MARTKRSTVVVEIGSVRKAHKRAVPMQPMPEPAELPTFFEFFAGGGMVRAALKERWRCTLANDFDKKKGETYRTNWGGEELITRDIRQLELSELVKHPDLVWASFPCQDLSLAGGGAGLKGDRSGTFYPFWDKVELMIGAGHAPSIIVLENVCGTLTSHEGKDFKAIIETFANHGYIVGAIVMDAELFVPQSRPRLFFIGVPKTTILPSFALGDEPDATWHPASLKRAYMRLPAKAKRTWVWWRMPKPARRNERFADIIEDNPADVEWHTPAETKRLLAMMSPVHKKKVAQARLSKRRMVGTIYKRTRRDDDGNSIQRAEVRFDDVAGCLRTPAGGSSRQVLLIVDGNDVRSRLISARETARLMGLPDSYKLPDRYNEAYHLTGDGVVVHVVKHLSENILLPLLDIRDGRMIA